MNLSRVRFFAFTVLLTLAVLWITSPVQKLSEEQTNTSQEVPQFSWQTENTTIWNLDTQSNRSQSIITSENFLYKNETKSSNFVNPKFYAIEDSSLTVMQSDTGLTANDSTILLNGNVTLKHQNGADFLDLNTTTLSYNSNSQTLETNESFELNFPQGKLTGQGMQANLYSNELLVKAKVNTTLYPNKINNVPSASAKNMGKESQ